MSQPFYFESGAKFARFNFLLGYVVAQQNERPIWNPGDFFGEHYGKRVIPVFQRKGRFLPGGRLATESELRCLTAMHPADRPYHSLSC